jgi:hypothetical protein
VVVVIFFYKTNLREKTSELPLCGYWVGPQGSLYMAANGYVILKAVRTLGGGERMVTAYAYLCVSRF